MQSEINKRMESAKDIETLSRIEKQKINMDKIYRLIFSILLGLSGFIWLLYLDWKIACAVFIMFWGNNVNISVDESNPR